MISVLSGLFALYFYPIRKKIFGRWRLLRMVRKERETVELLLNERKALMKELDETKKRHMANVKAYANL
jgi:hypothetical protein